jgi:hypothetical protein
MPQLISGFLVLGFLSALTLGYVSFSFLTRIIKIEHDEFFSEWEKDGQPHGMPFWFPVKEKNRALQLAADPWSKGYQWLFKMPDWIKAHERASQLFGYYRFTQFSFLFLLFAAIVVSLIFTFK